MAINVLDGQEGSPSGGVGAYGYGRGSNGAVGWQLGAGVSTGYFGCHYIRGSWDQMWWVFRPEFTIGYNFASGAVTLYRGDVFNTDPGFTLITTVSGPVLSGSVWHWAEGSYTASDAGTVTVAINGVTYLTISNVDNTLTATGLVKTLLLAAAGNSDCSYDNIYHFDSTGPAPYNNNIGEFRILGLIPTAAGSSTQFTPSTGSNYTCVDETSSNSDTDYIYSSTAVKKDLYTFSDLSVTPTRIFALALISQARRDDTQPHTFCNVLKSGVVEVSGATRTCTPNYVEYRDYFTADPNTGLVWTLSTVNALEAGVKLLT